MYVLFFPPLKFQGGGDISLRSVFPFFMKTTLRKCPPPGAAHKLMSAQLGALSAPVGALGVSQSNAVCLGCAYLGVCPVYAARRTVIVQKSRKGAVLCHMSTADSHCPKVPQGGSSVPFLTYAVHALLACDCEFVCPQLAPHACMQRCELL